MPKRDLMRRANQQPAGGGVTLAGVGVVVGPPNADTVDYLHAASIPVTGRLLALDVNSRYPASTITLADLSGLDLVSGLAVADSIAGDGLDIASKVLAVDAGDFAGAGLEDDGANNLRVAVSQDFVWTGGHTFQATMNTRHILPELTDMYDLGSSSKLWRKGWLSELDAVLFAHNTATLIGGWLIVGHGEGTLPADVAAAATQIDFGQAMSTGDFVLFRGQGQVEYISVGTLVSGTTYNVTRDLDGSGTNDWPAGSVYSILGQSGDGRIELNAYDTPRIAILEQGATYNAASDRVRIGDLNGSFGIGTELYGFGVGDYDGGNYLRYEPTNGFVMQSGAGAVLLNAEGMAITDSPQLFDPVFSYRIQYGSDTLGALFANHDAETTFEFTTLKAWARTSGYDGGVLVECEVPNGQMAVAGLHCQNAGATHHASIFARSLLNKCLLFEASNPRNPGGVMTSS